MAQLKDTIVSGNLRVTDTTLTDTLQVTTIKAPTSSGGSTYGPGTSGQILKSNGTMTYWTDMPTIPTVNNASLTLKGAGTTVTTFTANSSTNQSLDIVAGSNVTITPDATNHKITIASSYTNTDTKVKVTTSTSKAYLIGTTTSPNGTAVEGVGNTGVYMTNGVLTASSIYGSGTEDQSTIPNGGYHIYDCRSVNVSPNDGDKAANFYFHMTDMPNTSLWWSVLHMRGWTGAYAAWEIAGPSDSKDQRTTPLYVRTSNTNTAWGSWRKIYDTSNPPTASEVGALASSTKYAGSSSAGGAATSANKINTDAGATNRPVYFSGGVPVQCATPASSSWFKGVPLITADGVMEIGKYIDFHNTNGSTADYDYRMEITTATMTLHATGSSNILTIKSPDYTQLCFQTTSSGKAYTASGIICYPLTDTGMTSLFSFGGNVVIGGGEAAKTLYDNNYDTIKTAENEDLYLCADHDIHIVTGCQTYSDKSIIEIDAIGKVYLPATGGIIVKQQSDSNYVSATTWWNGGTAPESGEYAPHIGQHNTGGDSSYPGSICILPYKSTTNPWDGTVGLFIKKDHVYIDGVELSKSGHTHNSLYGVSSTSAVPVTTLANGQLKVFYNVNNGLSGNMPATNNANAIIQINKHGGNYDTQLGFSSNGNIYYRSCNGVVLSASVPWRRIYDTSNPPTASEVGALASSTKYAGSSSVGGAANSSNVLNSNTRMDYGWDGVNYFNINGTAGNAAKVNDTPTTAWWHIMRFNMYNSSGYYTDLAIPFNTTSLYYKRITAGSVQNGGWVKVLDALNVGYVMSSVIKYDPHAKRFTSSKTDAAWNAQAYSNTGYADNVYVSFRAGQTTMYAMIGLDANPSEDANYDKIDYCWYIQNNGALKVYESGTAVTITGHTTYASGDEFRVEYSCGEIRYYHNGTMCRSVTRAVSGKLFFDSSFHNAGNVYDFSYGTSTHSTHTAEIITSTYKSTSFVTSLTNSVITLSDAASSFGGWICGPTKNGRIAISSYQGSDDKLYFGYGERGRTTNSYAKAMTWDGPTNTLTADKFVGALQGNATRADYVNVVAGNEIRFYNDNQFKANNQFWLGYSWAQGSHYTPSGGSDTSSTTAPNITKFIMGNCSQGGLASVHAKTFILGNGSSPTHTSKTTTIATAATTTDRTITLPDASGTIAVFPAARTSGQVVVTDGTAGGVKSSGYTIATSVPSGAKFTDANLTQTAVGSTYTKYRPIVISNAYSDTEGFSPSTTTGASYITSSLYCQPSSGMLHANIFKAGKTSTTDGEMIFYNSGGSGVTTLKATAQSTSGTYLLPARGNLKYTLSCGHEDLSAPTGSLSAANVLVPSYTKFIKIVFKSDGTGLYSMVEIPYFGNGDYGALVQVGTFGDSQGAFRIIMKAVIILITDGTRTGTKNFSITASPTTKINGSNVSDITRNITIHKIYATD